MEGVTGMMARLSHVPGCSRGGLYGPANIDFRFDFRDARQLRLQRACHVPCRWDADHRIADGAIGVATAPQAPIVAK